MSGKRRRRISMESDDEGESNDTLEGIKHFNTVVVNRLVHTVNPRFDTMDKNSDEIKQKIAAHHDETQYVHRKHQDQARMLATLNEKINNLQAINDDQNTTIQALHGDIRNLQDSALGDCAGLFERIKEKVSTVKSIAHDLRDEARKSNGELEALKSRVAAIETDMSTIKDLLLEIKGSIKKHRS